MWPLHYDGTSVNKIHIVFGLLTNYVVSSLRILHSDMLCLDNINDTASFIYY
jgi:hypothetical protein